MKFVYCFILLFSIIVNSPAQQVTINGNFQDQIVRYWQDGQYFYNYDNSHSVGRSDGRYNSGSTEDTWRSETEFLLGIIPQNATITQARINIYCSNYFNPDMKLKITKTTGQFSWNLQWENIDNSNIIISNVPYGSGAYEISNELKNAVIDALPNGVLYLGALAIDEMNNDTYARVEIQLIIDYTVPPANIDITAENNFNGGTIKVGINTAPVQQNNPYSFSPLVGQTVNLEAQDQFHGGFNRVWNDFASNAKSSWQKNNVDISYFIQHSFTTAEDDNDATYKAGLRKKFSISVNEDCTEFDNLITNASTTYIVEQNSGQISTPTTKTVNGKDYKFSGWTDNLTTANPRTITPNNNQTYTAFYKYPHHSTSTAALAKNNQRKLIRDDNGIYHLVYVSMDKLWYTRSSTTNFNGNWETEEHIDHVIEEEVITNPSIDINENTIAIVYETTDNEYSFIYLVLLDINTGSANLHQVAAIDNNYYGEANAVVAFSDDEIFVLYRKNSTEGIKYKRYLEGSQSWTWENENQLPYTDQSSKNLSIAREDDGYILHMVWQNGTSSIEY